MKVTAVSFLEPNLYTSFEGKDKNLIHLALSKYSLKSMANELIDQT